MRLVCFCLSLFALSTGCVGTEAAQTSRLVLSPSSLSPGPQDVVIADPTWNQQAFSRTEIHLSSSGRATVVVVPRFGGSDQVAVQAIVLNPDGTSGRLTSSADVTRGVFVVGMRDDGSTVEKLWRREEPEYENFVRSPKGVTTPIPPSSNVPTNCKVVAISPSGVAAGVAGSSVVRWDDLRRPPVQLQSLAGAEVVGIGGVNDRQEVVGEISGVLPLGVLSVARWDRQGTPTVLSSPDGEPRIAASALLDGDGNVVAHYQSKSGNAAQRQTAICFWRSGADRAIDLQMPGDTYPRAFDLNRGVTVGVAIPRANGQYQALCWRDPLKAPEALKPTRAGDGTVATAVNGAGFVSGFSTNKQRFGVAIVWRPDGTPVDLNSMAKVPANLVLTEAWRLNDVGWVAGIASDVRKDDGSARQRARLFVMRLPWAAAKK